MKTEIQETQPVHLFNKRAEHPEPNRVVEGRLLWLAGLFLALYATALTLAPSVRARAWVFDVETLNLWVGFSLWVFLFRYLHQQATHLLPYRDPYLLPIAGLFSGWGLLTIYRLLPEFGLRQTIWLGCATVLFAYGLRLPSSLGFLRRYKYIWLTSGLLLTALTLLFGVNPLGAGPRLWLGCCGVYLQPSEPLKLLLIVYLAAYFAAWTNLIASNRPPAERLNVLTPTLIMTSLALLLLLFQRDLGTAFLFILIYSVMAYLATGWRWIPLFSGLALMSAGSVGYLVFDVIRLRVDAWLNPWVDPAGRSYQIVQSLMAVANGGLLGRGPGAGYPNLVPVAHSDFIFTAIAEETGMVGSFALLVLIGLLAYRGLRIALHAPDTFRRYLAAGVTTHLVAQSLLIIGGNLRLLPLTGVTLPFVSYGGSSLLVSFLELLMLLHISASTSEAAAIPQLRFSRPVLHLTSLLFVVAIGAGVANGWWAFVRGPDLLTRTDNPRRAIADRFIPRGSFLAREGSTIIETRGSTGQLYRWSHYPDLSPIIGYNHPTYGQTGLEAEFDPYLRGIAGYQPSTIWWHHLLYGQPPPGLDIRLTLDLDLQRMADQALEGKTGALLLLDAQTGEILVMSSRPTFNANTLDEDWEALIQDPGAPLINRITQGSYPLGNLAVSPFYQTPSNQQVEPLPFQLPVVIPAGPDEATPLDIALVAATLSNAGTRPLPYLVQMVENPDGGWTLLTPPEETTVTIPYAEVQATTARWTVPETDFWGIAYSPPGEGITWYIGGTLPGHSNPLAIVLVLEETNPELATQIGENLLNAATFP